MKKLLLVITVVALLIGMFSFAAYAYGPCGGGRGFGWLKSLNLTDTQKQQIKTIRQNFYQNTKSLRQEIRQDNQALMKLWKADTLDQTAITAQSSAIIPLRIQLVQQTHAMISSIKAVLTQAQLTQLANQKQNHRGCHGWGMCGCF